MLQTQQSIFIVIIYIVLCLLKNLRKERRIVCAYSFRYINLCINHVWFSLFVSVDLCLPSNNTRSYTWPNIDFLRYASSVVLLGNTLCFMFYRPNNTIIYNIYKWCCLKSLPHPNHPVVRSSLSPSWSPCSACCPDFSSLLVIIYRFMVSFSLADWSTSL